MYRRATRDIPAARERELRAAAYYRYSACISAVCAWLSTVLGAFALFIVFAGYRHGFRLPDAPRPNVGPGFSERVTAVIGAFWFGGWISLVALLFVGVALLHSKRRLHKLIFALPALLCIALIAFQPQWLFRLLRYGL